MLEYVLILTDGAGSNCPRRFPTTSLLGRARRNQLAIRWDGYCVELRGLLF